MNNFLKTMFMVLLTGLLISGCKPSSESNIINEKWAIADSILKVVVPPQFKEAQYNVADFGAKASPEFNSKPAIQKAIDECSTNGGGTVIIPKGEYFSEGSLFLKDNVNLHISEGALLRFSTNPNHYLPVVLSRWEGVECYNYSALIYAKDVKNIAVTGKGVLHGNSSTDDWWIWKSKKEFGWTEARTNQSDKVGRPRLLEMNNTDVPVEERIFGNGYYLRPNFIQFINCENILFEDFTIKDSPMWFINPVLCKNITVSGIKIIGKGPNNDGFDPESCSDIVIKDCFFDNGDDCIAIKSGRNNDGRRINVPSQNIVIKDCKMNDGHGGVVIGSEISGGCRNVFAENCYMNSPHLDRALRIKTNRFRGGVVENIFLRKIVIGKVNESVVKINLNYDIKNESGDEFMPTVRNVYLTDIKSKSSTHAFYFDGLPESKIMNVKISDSELNGVEDGNIINNIEGFVVDNVLVNGKEFKYKK